MSPHIEARSDAGVLSLALARPEKKNAFTDAMYLDLVGHPIAFAMFALGRTLDAAAAAQFGVATEVVPAPRLLERAREQALKLASLPLGSLMTTKALMRDPKDTVARIDDEKQRFMARLWSAEAGEAFRAFLEQRPPNFQAVTG